MTLRQLFIVPLLALLAWSQVALAQNAVPDHRYLYSRDVDFYGSDLTNLFDTTQQACARACSAQPGCVAFTFNTRSNACFPKSDVSDVQAYVGAMSARKYVTDPAIAAIAPQRRAELTFITNRDITRARSFASRNATQFSFDENTTLAALIARSDPGAGGVRAALRWAGMAAALGDRSDLWATYARLSLQAASSGNSSSRRRDNNDALLASINAYLRAFEDISRIEALELMARALEATRRGRDMIPALRLAISMEPRQDLLDDLDTAIGKYGFRVVRHRVDNNAAAPRICAEFSEPLVKVGVDYETFVRLEGRGFAVQAEGAQLCIDGVEHGQRYDVTIRQGLPAASGEALHKDVRLRLYVRDRAQSVRFPGRAYVLPRTAKAALPIETVNVDNVDLKLRRMSDRNLVRAIRDGYFGRPLREYLDRRFARELAEEVWTGTGKVENELNLDMVTTLPMGDVLSNQTPGVYALSASVPGLDPYQSAAAMQWFVLSDLGISTLSGVDGLHVTVRSLADTTPRADAQVTLISQANAVLSTVQTDAEGFAQFPAGLTRGNGAASPALVMVEDGEDFSFLPLTDPAFDLSDRGVAGNRPAPPIDTFLTTERGAYRVGETIYATALTRDAQARALEGLPVTAILYRPDGVEYSRQLSQDPKVGGHVFAMPLGGDVPRGAWRLDVLSDLEAPALASQTVLVEDFLPERIDFDLTLADAPLRLSTTPTLQVDTRYLFGAPGADLAVEGTLQLRGSRTRDGWDGYRFGRYDNGFFTRTRIIGDERTDAQGRANMTLQMPRAEDDPGMPLTASLTVRVSETSGRPVERQLSAPVAPAGMMIGIKPKNDDVLPEQSDARFDLIALTPEGAAAELPVRWTVNKIERRYQWYQLSGRWNWEATTRRIRVQTGEVTLGAEPVTVSAPTEWGSYEIVVERLGTPYLSSSYRFYAGWYENGDDANTPDRLEMSLNAEAFSPGDPVSVRAVAERAGTALVSILSNRVIERQVVPIRAGENTIPLTVTDEWGTGAYVTISVLHPMDEDADVNPSRSLGIAHAIVRPGPRALSVSIDAPDIVDGQDGSMRARVQVDGITQGEDAYITLAAVDLGVLNLTRFEAPDVTDHYFGKRRLGVEVRDIYGRLIDGLGRAPGEVRSGGGIAEDQQQSPPPNEKLMTFFAGPFKVEVDGSVDVEILKPAFNGTVKLMVVAWSPTGVGDAERDVIARDPVVVSGSLPRFLSPGDQSRLLLEIVHAEGPAGDMALSVVADAGLALQDTPTRISLAPEGTTRLNLPLTAREVGDHQITAVLTTPAGKELRKVLTLGVRDNDTPVSLTRQFTLGVGERFTFDANVFAGFRAGSGYATLTAGPLARFDVPGLLQQLDRYPYGCTEQITSAAMPLLYLGNMAAQAGMGEPKDIDNRIEQAIARILTRQSSGGGFGLWRSGSGEFWLDAYVTDFLSRAKAAGYDVPPLAFSIAMDNLRNRVNYTPDFDRGGTDLAYALLVLAREGAANMGDLRYYADIKGDAFSTPMAAAQLAAALASYGDMERADTMFRRAGFLLLRTRDNLAWRSDFGSSLRDTAAVLALSAEAGSSALDPATLISLVKDRTQRLSTQEASQVVMAAHALSAPDAVPALRVNGAIATGPVVERLSAQVSGMSIIENVSQVPMDVTMTAYGIPQVPPQADGYGYRITRSYYTMEGEVITGSVQSGDRLVTVLEITPFEQVGARLIIDDPLPAGFEIDNPNLIQSGNVRALDWVDSTRTETVEFRSDRFVAAVNHRGAERFQLAYVVRAVTPGTYHHPGAVVEDMYRAEYRANTDQGRVTVLP